MDQHHQRFILFFSTVLLFKRAITLLDYHPCSGAASPRCHGNYVLQGWSSKETVRPLKMKINKWKKKMPVHSSAWCLSQAQLVDLTMQWDGSGGCLLTLTSLFCPHCMSPSEVLALLLCPFLSQLFLAWPLCIDPDRQKEPEINWISHKRPFGISNSFYA